MKAIYRLRFNSGRMGYLPGIFVALKEDVNLLISSQIEIYFGEVLGKHSEVYGPIDTGEIELVTDDEKTVALFEEHKLETGYNPFNYSAMGESKTVMEEIEKLKEK